MRYVPAHNRILSDPTLQGHPGRHAFFYWTGFLLFALIGVVAIVFWHSLDSPIAARMAVSTPHMDGSPMDTRQSRGTIGIGEFFERYSSGSEATTHTHQGWDWPNFRGPDNDNISHEPVALEHAFGPEGPPRVWTVELGEGHAGPAIHNGRVYVLDYDEAGQGDALRCFDLMDGKELWRRWYRLPLKRNHGLSRTVPAVHDRYVVTLGPLCHVMCTDGQTGDLLWGLDLVADFGADVPLWNAGQCPLIDARNNLAILAPCGDSLMIGVDCETGEVVWQTPNPGNWKMSHASVAPMDLHGERLFVYSALGGAAAVYADGPRQGQIAWQNSDWNHSVVAPSAVHCPPDTVFLCAGYGAGAMTLRITPSTPASSVDSTPYTATVLQEIDASKGFSCEQQTPILWQDRLFGILPKNAGPMRNQFVCVNPEDITRFQWSSGTTERFGLGPWLLADGKFFILSDEAVLTITRAATEDWDKLAQHTILPDARDAWGPMALSGGYLLLRDATRMVCLDLRANASDNQLHPKTIAALPASASHAETIPAHSGLYP